MRNKFFLLVLVAFFLIGLSPRALSQCACFRETEYNCGSTAGFMYCYPYGCSVPELYCPSNEYCDFYIPGYSKCAACPNNNPNCNALSPIQRRFKDITTTKDPVDIFSGEQYFSSTDFFLKGRGPVLALKRRYRSFANFTGIFGYGWRTDFDLNLTHDNYGDVTVYNGDGTEIFFTNNSGSYINSPGNFFTLIKNPDNTYTTIDVHGIAYHYDLTGRLNSITDRNGNVLTFVYDPSVSGGTYIQDASGRKIVLNFNANGYVATATDPAGKTYQYFYDSIGDLQTVIDPTNATTTYSANGSHQITQFTNANNHNTYYQFDGQGRVYQTWQDNNVHMTTLNFQGNNTTTVTDSLSNSITYVFNSTGLLISKTDALNDLTQESWDGNMDMVSFMDPNNNTTNFLYDVYGDLIQTTDAAGDVTNMSYSSNFNLLTSRQDERGNTTVFNYDNFGNLTSIVDPLGKTHSFTYDQFGDVVTATDSRSNVTTFVYDAFGHLIQKVDALGNAFNYTYE